MIKLGDKVTLEYTLALVDGTVIEEAGKDEPLTVEVGSTDIMESVERALIGMESGQDKLVEIAPADGFGEVNPDLTIMVPFEDYPEGMALKPGETFMLPLPSGDSVPAMVTGLDENGVTIDLNHPLAGEALVVKINVIAVA